jgi:hypothetical protein
VRTAGPARQRPGHRAAGRRPGGRAGGVGQRPDQGGHGHEGGGVGQQHRRPPDQADQQAAHGRADQRADLVAHAEQDVGPLELGLVDQAGEGHPDADVGGRDQGPGGHSQPVEERHVEPAEPVQRRDGPDQGGPGQVVGHHHPPQRPAVEHAAEQRPGHHRGQPGAEQDQAHGRPRPGEVEHEPDQGDGGQLVAGARQQHAGRQPPHGRAACRPDRPEPHGASSRLLAK